MKSKIGSIFLSVAVAFGLWLYVITAVSPGSTETYYNIPIIMDGESILNNDRRMMVTSVSHDSVTLRLSGNRTDLSKVNSGNITVKMDLSKIYEPGSQTLNYTISYPGDVPSNAFVIESKYPGSILVNVARWVTKEVPVQVKWIGSAAEGYISDRENRVLDYPNVTITGPDTVVDTIEMATIDVDLNGQTESISQNYRYTLCDKDGEPVDASLVTTNVEEIHLDVKILRVWDVTLICAISEGGGATADNVQITMNPQTIRVSGSEAAMEQLGTQMTVGLVNLNELVKSAELTFDVQLPVGINNLTGVTKVTASVELTGLLTKELTIEEIGSVNVPEGMAAELITEKMTVVVRGPIDQISKLTSRDVTVNVDFTGAEMGTSNYKAIITFADGFDKVGVFRADPVSASLQAAPDEGTKNR